MPSTSEVRNVINSFIYNLANKPTEQCGIEDNKPYGYILTCSNSDDYQIFFSRLSSHIQVPYNQRKQLITANAETWTIYLSWEGWAQLKRLDDVKKILNEEQNQQLLIQDIQSAQYSNKKGGFFLTFANEEDALDYCKHVKECLGETLALLTNGASTTVQLSWDGWQQMEEMIKKMHYTKQVLNNAQSNKYPIQDIQSAQYSNKKGGFFLTFANKEDASNYCKHVKECLGDTFTSPVDDASEKIQLSWDGWKQIEETHYVKQVLNNAQSNRYPYPIKNVQSAQDTENGGYLLTFENNGDAIKYNNRVQKLFGGEACCYDKESLKVYLYWSTWKKIESEEKERKEVNNTVINPVLNTLSNTVSNFVNQTTTTNTYPQINNNNNSYNYNSGQRSTLFNNNFNNFNNNSNNDNGNNNYNNDDNNYNNNYNNDDNNNNYNNFQ